MSTAAWPASAGASLRPVAAVVLVAMPAEAQPSLDALPRHAAARPLALSTASSVADVWHLELPPRPAGGHPTTATGLPRRAWASAREFTTGLAADGSPRELVLVRTGIGLVNAASALSGVLAEVEPEVVLSAGTAGGLARGVSVGDVCLSTTLAYADADATAFGYVRGQVPGMPAVYTADPGTLARAMAVGPAALARATPTSGAARLHRGQMLAGNSFVTAANVADTRQTFPEAVSTDMESTALAQVCTSRGLPFLSVRGVSDLCGPEAGEDFHIGAEVAAARSAAVVLALLG